MFPNLREQALSFHRKLPRHLCQLLVGHGIVKLHIQSNLIGWNDKAITVPVFGPDRQVLFFERYDVLEDGRLHRQESGNPVALYCAHVLSWKPQTVVIAQGILDCLVLSGEAFFAVSATGDGLCFKEEWAVLFSGAQEVFVCLKRGATSEQTGARISGLLPGALVLKLPEVLAPGQGIAEYFAHGFTRVDFLRLLDAARTEQRIHNLLSHGDAV